MPELHQSELAKNWNTLAETGVSASMIQKLRSGENTNISLKKFVLILSALHYQIKFEKAITDGGVL